MTERSNPSQPNCGESQREILGLGVWASNSWLFLWTPRDIICSKKKTITRGAPSCNETTCLDGIIKPIKRYCTSG